ncbi:fatty acid desaturase family protein [Pedobacter gandavensis]|uniref:fatty acid desaturase family protein n=1 Tax=Pedobacter gandavensis TaxID=2679963 RepID=UPI0029308DCF|nr:fatty acid desaturase [Pedobacter gandavensis]
MKDKHIYIARDSELLKTIYKQVEEQLIVNKVNFTLKIWTKFIFYFTFTAVCYSALFTTSNSIAFVLCFVLYGFISLLFAFNFSHDFSHNTIFKSKKINNLCFIFIYTIVGAHAEAWKQRHIHSHHYAPNVEDYDSDLKISKLIRVIPNSEHYWFHRYQHFYAPFAYTIYSLFWIFIKDFVILFSTDQYTENKNLKYHLSFWAQKAFYLTFILLLPLLFSMQPWFIVLAGFLAMHLSQSLFLLFTFFMTHHVEQTEYPTTDSNGFIKTSWLMNQIKSSNDMHPFSETANFILGGFNNHIAHHLFPHYHHIHYPKLNRILYSILLEHNISPNQTTYWGGIASHLRLLKRMS